MAYSRWSTSRWYTFWSSNSKSDKPNDQVFEICDLNQPLLFTYKELTQDINQCLNDVQAYYSKAREVKLLANLDDLKNPVYKDTALDPEPVSKKELTELKSYMENFIKDIEESNR